MTITREEYDLDGYIRWKKDKFSKEFYGQLLRVLMDENGMSTGELEVKMQLEESAGNIRRSGKRFRRTEEALP